MVKVTRPIKQGSFFRHRLFDQLDQMRKSQVIWISAPAGAGKTTLVSTYIENGKIPCLWYQCDKDDDDPATFFYYMGVAAAKAFPGKRKPLPFFTPEYRQGISTFTRNYFQQLYLRLEKPSLMILDNYQDVVDTSIFSNVLQTAFTHIPEGINLIVISRQDPPDIFIRMQANGSMDVLRWQDIRLTKEEARSIIQTRSKILDSEEIIQNLYAMSDGWAAGLVLLVTALRNQKIRSTFTGKHSYDEIIAYFDQEVFQRLDSNTQDFFLRTAFLPKMTARMAAQLTGKSSARDILRMIDKQNYFIARLGNTEPLYEYHPLYRNYLLSQAGKRLPPGQLHDVQRQSADLLEQNGQTEAAVSLLQEIQDWQSLIRLVLTHAPEMLKQGRHNLLRKWLEIMPPGIRNENPWLIYWNGMSILSFDPTNAQPHFEQAFGIFQKKQDAIGAILSASGVIQAICLGYDNFLPLDHWYDVLNQLARTTKRFPSEETEASVITSLIMASTFREIFPPEMKLWEDHALRIPEQAALINIKAQALHSIFWHRLLYLGSHEALPLLSELKRLSRLPEAQPIISLIAQIATIQYYLHMGQHDQLLDETQKGFDISQKTGIHYADMWFNAHKIESFINRMDCQGARTLLVRIMPDAEGWPNWTKNLYHLELMCVALINKEYAQALFEGTLALDLSKRAGAPVAIASTQLLLAQYFLMMEEREKALGYLGQVHSYANQKNLNCFKSTVLMCYAQIAFDDGETDQGFLFLDKSLALAREFGLYFSFPLNIPDITLRMCLVALEKGIEVEYVQHIIRQRAFIPESPPVHLENWPWPIKIYTMGRFEILIDGTPLPAQRKVQQAPLRLFKALISGGGREVTEVWLADMLWPDSEGDAAHHALEMTLQRLRKLLGYPEAIRLIDGKLSLNNRYCWIDAWAFVHLQDEADACKNHDALRKKGLLEKSIALYKGRFLAGEREEAWMISSDERLKSRYFKSIWECVTYLEEQGLWAQIADLCEKFLAVDEYREDIYRKLMVCYKNLGRPSEALLVYQRCCRIFSSVLGITPSPTMQNLYKTILSEKH